MPAQQKCSYCGLVQFDSPGAPCRSCTKPLGNDTGLSRRSSGPASTNPYQAPHTSQTAPADITESRENLKQIARGQRIVIYSILAQLGLVVFFIFGHALLPKPLLGVVAVVGVLGAAAMSLFGTFVLSKSLYGVLTAVVHLILGMILGFFLLLYLSSQANRRFKKARIRVGLLGVPASEFE